MQGKKKNPPKNVERERERERERGKEREMTFFCEGKLCIE